MDWDIEIKNNKVIVRKKNITIVDNIEDFYELLKCISTHLSNIKKAGCIRLHNTTTNISMVVNKNKIRPLYNQILEFKPKVDQLFNQQKNTAEL